nr:ethyl tert-butyl ether degradation protein EthD [Myxosarcina sp. GI1]
MLATTRKTDYAIRDRQGKLAFYVLLWKRKSINLSLFDNYWRDVHGPVCARLPGQHQYWQFHLDRCEGELWPTVPGVEYTCAEANQFEGIAELTFTSEAERNLWFESASILMDDEHNIFSKAIGYNTSLGNSITYVDGIPSGQPNGKLDLLKFHIMVKKSPSASIIALRQYLKETFAPTVSQSESVLKLRLHLFEAVDNSRADASGVSHFEPPEEQYQAAIEIAFANPLEMEKFFASPEYAIATRDLSRYVRRFLLFPERTAYTFVYDGEMTLAGQRSSTVAELIANIGATNQLKEDVTTLMMQQQLIPDRNGANGSSSNGNGTLTSLNTSGTGNSSEAYAAKPIKKRTNYYRDLAADYSRPGLVTSYVAKKLIEDGERYAAMKEATLPEINASYTLTQIERENKDWWVTHCEALRQGRGDILTAEYREDLVYFCQDGPYQGLDQQKEREKHWWALIAQPGVTMCWPIVMFHGEVTYFEWKCVDDETNETTAKGSVTWMRRGHRGGCYLKTEQLTFYRDVFASDNLLNLIKT